MQADQQSALLPCPFCGAGDTQIEGKGMWTGQGYSEPISVSVRHWCTEVPGQPSRMIERIGRDRASAIEAWNRRAALSHPSPQRWKLVPVEPTLDMGWAYLDAARADDPRGAEELRFSWPGYRAMLNAAPPPPEQGGKG